MHYYGTRNLTEIECMYEAEVLLLNTNNTFHAT